MHHFEKKNILTRFYSPFRYYHSRPWGWWYVSRGRCFLLVIVMMMVMHLFFFFDRFYLNRGWFLMYHRHRFSATRGRWGHFPPLQKIIQFLAKTTLNLDTYQAYDDDNEGEGHNNMDDACLIILYTCNKLDLHLLIIKWNLKGFAFVITLIEQSLI